MSDALDQRLRLRRRQNVVFLFQPSSKFVIGADGAGPVPQIIEEGDEMGQLPFVLGREPGRPPRQRRRVGSIPGHPIPVRQRPGTRCRAAAQGDSLLFHPPLELGRRLRNEEPVQKVALKEIQGFGVPPRLAGLHKCGCVTPQHAAVYPDFLFAATHDDALAQRAAKEAQRLAQRSPCMLLVQLGPEQRDHGVPATEA